MLPKFQMIKYIRDHTTIQNKKSGQVMVQLKMYSSVIRDLIS